VRVLSHGCVANFRALRLLAKWSASMIRGDGGPMMALDAYRFLFGQALVSNPHPFNEHLSPKARFTCGDTSSNVVAVTGYTRAWRVPATEEFLGFCRREWTACPLAVVHGRRRVTSRAQYRGTGQPHEIRSPTSGSARIRPLTPGLSPFDCHDHAPSGLKEKRAAHLVPGRPANRRVSQPRNL